MYVQQQLHEDDHSDLRHVLSACGYSTTSNITWLLLNAQTWMSVSQAASPAVDAHTTKHCTVVISVQDGMALLMQDPHSFGRAAKAPFRFCESSRNFHVQIIQQHLACC